MSEYFKCTYVGFSNYKYSTNWQKFNIGIMWDVLSLHYFSFW